MGFSLKKIFKKSSAEEQNGASTNQKLERLRNLFRKNRVSPLAAAATCDDLPQQTAPKKAKIPVHTVIKKAMAKRKAAEATIAIFGLSAAGKTSIARKLPGGIFLKLTQRVRDIKPTKGCQKLKAKIANNSVKIKDFGASGTEKSTWSDHYPTLHGVVFVLDCADNETFDEAQVNLRALMENRKLSGKPFLVLANKIDKIDGRVLIKDLDLINLATNNRCPVTFATCDAYKNTREENENIERAFARLVELISVKWDTLDGRVQKDLEEKKAAKLQMKKEAEQVAKNSRLQDTMTAFCRPQ